MDGYHFLFDMAIILLATKLMGLLTKKFQLPQVVGALVAGLVLGPAVFNVVRETEFIKATAELGVIVLMFCAGMETEKKRQGFLCHCPDRRYRADFRRLRRGLFL